MNVAPRARARVELNDAQSHPPSRGPRAENGVAVAERRPVGEARVQPRVNPLPFDFALGDDLVKQFRPESFGLFVLLRVGQEVGVHVLRHGRTSDAKAAWPRVASRHFWKGRLPLRSFSSRSSNRWNSRSYVSNAAVSGNTRT